MPTRKHPAGWESHRLVLFAAALVVLLAAGTAVGLEAADNQSALPVDKQEFVDELVAAQASADVFASEYPELLPTKSPGFLPTGTHAPWPQGLLPRPISAAPAAEFIAKDTWQWDINGNHIQVFAGLAGDLDRYSGRGALMLRALSFDLEPVPLGGWYYAPIGTGPLHIVEYEETLLTIEAETGEMFYFNAETRAFTDVNGDPVPTDAPTPTPPPLAPPVGTLPPFDFPTDTAPAQTASAVPAP